MLFVFCAICHQCSALPVPEDSKHVIRRRATTGSGSVAAFIESGRMVNDYVWVDVTTKKFVPLPGNDLEFGDCVDDSDDELIYFDNTVIENSGPSTLNGTLEVGRLAYFRYIFRTNFLTVLLNFQLIEVFRNMVFRFIEVNSSLASKVEFVNLCKSWY